MRKDIAAGTYNAYIVVKDDEGNLAKTEFTFIVKEKPIPSISLELSGRSGEADLIVLSVIGPENQASAKATIEVIPATMTFDLVEGRDNQTVVAGQDIAPIVYQYSHMYSVKGNVPANLKVEQDKEKKQVKISGTIDPESATHEYTYTFELTDYYENTKTVTGKINVVPRHPRPRSRFYRAVLRCLRAAIILRISLPPCRVSCSVTPTTN